jgi:DNA-binding transcriptional ArsR family regulator
MPVPVASQYLRALNARGLLKAVRRGRCVFYEASADSSMPETDVLLKSLYAVLRSDNTPKSIVDVLTAFTHPRRIELLQAIDKGAMDRRSLKAKTGISARALTRHLLKLGKRGYVISHQGKYRCAYPNNTLAKALMKLILQKTP